MKRFILICLFASVLPTFAFSGSNGFVAGRVTDKKTGFAVEEATVTIAGLNKSTLTDGDGFFCIADVPAGNVAISFSCDGCENLKRDETIRSNSITTINASLNRSNTNGEPKLNTEPVKVFVQSPPSTEEPVETKPQTAYETADNQPAPTATTDMSSTYPTIISNGYGTPAHLYRGTQYHSSTQRPNQTHDTHPQRTRIKP